MSRSIRSLASAALGLFAFAVCAGLMITVHSLHLNAEVGALNSRTGSLFVAAVCAGLFGIGEIINYLFGLSKPTRASIRLSAVTLSLMWMIAEVILRFGTSTYATYFERNGANRYRSLYDFDNRSSWFYVHQPNQLLRFQKTEFEHVRHVNSLGLCERELPLTGDPNEYRILALGDSYTEGVGTDYETTWVKVLETELRRLHPERSISTMNAGISGSDIFFQELLLRERLLPLEPDLVIVGMNSSDIADVIVRGGESRFQPDGTVAPRRGSPDWEWIYGSSFLVRFLVHEFFGYNMMFIQRAAMPEEESRALEEIRSATQSLINLASAEDFRLIFVFLPLQHEAMRGRYDSSFGDLAGELSSTRSPRIDVLDLLRAFANDRLGENVRNFYWPIDYHFNSKGYTVVGLAIADAVRSQLRD